MLPCPYQNPLHNTFHSRHAQNQNFTFTFTLTVVGLGAVTVGMAADIPLVVVCVVVVTGAIFDTADVSLPAVDNTVFNALLVLAAVELPVVVDIVGMVGNASIGMLVVKTDETVGVCTLGVAGAATLAGLTVTGETTGRVAEAVDVTGVEVVVALVVVAAKSPAAATVLALLVESVPTVDAADPLLVASPLADGLLAAVEFELTSVLLIEVVGASMVVTLEAAGADNGAEEVVAPDGCVSEPVWAEPLTALELLLADFELSVVLLSEAVFVSELPFCSVVAASFPDLPVSFDSVVATSFFSVATTSFLSVVPASFLSAVEASFLSVVAASFLSVAVASLLSVAAASFLSEAAASFLSVVAASFLSVVAASFLSEVAASFLSEVAASFLSEAAASFLSEDPFADLSELPDASDLLESPPEAAGGAVKPVCIF